MDKGSIDHLTVARSIVYFTANEANTGNELWMQKGVAKSDVNLAPRTEYRIALGNTAVRVGKYDVALTEFQHAVDGMDKNSKAAADLYLRLIDADPLFEAAYRNLMLLMQRKKDPAEARAVYERLRTVLSMRLKMMPSAETQAVFAALSC